MPLPTSSLFPVVGGLLVATLCLSMFLPIGLTCHETCIECQGKGTVTCTTCRGSGKCWFCEGTGKIWRMPEDGWCAAYSGSGGFYTCEGLC